MSIHSTGSNQTDESTRLERVETGTRKDEHEANRNRPGEAESGAERS